MKVFIDGKAGTTGLRIYERLSGRKDIRLLSLCEQDRKDPEKRKEMINASDITFLCLPDEASKEAVTFIENENVKIIDTSTYHRTMDGWSYGFPELSEVFFDSVKNGKRVSVPGCHASGFISLIFPLVKNGLINKDYPLSCFSLTGYSGGGKSMIADYEREDRPENYMSPRQYGTSQCHKHLKEMQKITGVARPPVFSPIVAPFYSGMQVCVPLVKDFLPLDSSVRKIAEAYSENYKDSKIVSFDGVVSENTFLNAMDMSMKDSMKISVVGNDDRIILCATYDNLGKGASGAAIECMNIMSGLDETAGLVL